MSKYDLSEIGFRGVLGILCLLSVSLGLRASVIQAEAVSAEAVSAEAVPAEAVPAEAVPAAAVPAAAVPAESFLRDGTLDTLGENGSPWRILGDLESGEVRIVTHADGNRTLRVCSHGKAGTRGMVQYVHFETPCMEPLVFGGSALVHETAEPVHGAKRQDFDIYLDIFYEDGTPLWGQKVRFELSGDEWQKDQNIIWPEKPIRKIEFFVLFRDFSGDVEFDDIFLKTHTMDLETIRLAGGLSGDGSILASGRFLWHSRFLKDDFRCEFAELVHGDPRQAVQVPVVCHKDGIPHFQAAGRPAETGGVKTFRLRVWHEGELAMEKLFQCDTSERKINGQAGGLLLQLESSMRRVYLEDLPEYGKELPGRPEELEAKLDLARGESESFQLTVLSGKEIPAVELTFSDLVSVQDPNVKLPADSCEWQQVGYIKTPKITEHSAEKSGLPLWFPDPLLARKTGFVPADQRVSFWVTVSSRQDTPAGTYRGTMTWKPLAEGLNAVEIPLEVTVWPVTIPVENHLGSAFALMDGFLQKVYGKDCDLPKIRRAYGDLMLRHRLAPEGDISRTEMPSLELLQEWKDRGLGPFNILNMAAERGERAWVCNSDPSFYTPEMREKFLNQLRPYVEELRRLGLTDRAYIYTFDERGEEYHPIMTEFFGMVKENFPEIATFTTAYIGTDTELLKKLNVDWTCPLTSVYDFEEAEECRRNGQKVWSYICCGPREPYANIMFRFPLIESRILGWQAFEQKYDGLLYWGVNIWSHPQNKPIDPNETLFFDWPVDWCFGGTWIYGDGRLLYPNVDGTALGSLRMANLRDAYEDYELLWMLREKDPELAKNLCAEVFTTPTDFTRDPEKLANARRKILEALTRSETPQGSGPDARN